jgi:hypothetical protein
MELHASETCSGTSMTSCEDVEEVSVALGINGRRCDDDAWSKNRPNNLLLINPVVDYDFSGSVTSNTPIIKSTNLTSNLANSTSDWPICHIEVSDAADRFQTTQLSARPPSFKAHPWPPYTAFRLILTWILAFILTSISAYHSKIHPLLKRQQRSLCSSLLKKLLPRHLHTLANLWSSKVLISTPMTPSPLSLHATIT